MIINAIMKMNKTLLFGMAIATMLSANTLNSYAKLPVEYGNFKVNGKNTKLALAELVIDEKPINKKTAGIDPVTINSRTLVPVRALSENLGYKVTWLETAKKVTIEDASQKIELVIGNPNAKVNNKTSKLPDSVSPLIINERTYVPIRFVVENMGLKIDYDAKLNKISLNSDRQKNQDIADTLFEERPQLEQGIEISKRQESLVEENDPSIPKDVDQFIKNDNVIDVPTIPSIPIKPDSPVITENKEDVSTPPIIKPQEPNIPDTDKKEEDKPKVEPPKEPEKPQEPKVEQIKETQEKPEVQENIIEAKYELTSKFTKEQNDMLTISQNYDNIDMNYFYLSSPKRLVIDVKNAKLSEYEALEKQLNGSVFLSMKSKYHSDKNYTRFVINIKEDVKNEEIQIDKKSNTLKIQKINIVKQGGQFTYNFDRKTGTLTIKTSKNTDLQNLSDDPSSIKLAIPKDTIRLNKGNLNISNRLIKSVSISEEGSNYILKISLGDRVTYSIKRPALNSTAIYFNKQDRQRPRVVVDPGHGGKDAGAVNYKYGVTEKGLNIQVGTKLKRKLQAAGYEVFMTRESDVFVPLNDIAQISNNYDTDVFISIHHNSATSKSARGIETFYYKGADSKKLADTVHKYILPASTLKNRGVKSAPFLVIRKTTSPAILMELGFISNDAETQKIMSDSYQEEVTDAIVSSLKEYFGR